MYFWEENYFNTEQITSAHFKCMLDTLQCVTEMVPEVAAPPNDCWPYRFPALIVFRLGNKHTCNEVM